MPDEAQPRRAASAPMPEVGQGAEAFIVGSLANAFILGVNAAYQQGQVIAAPACWLTLKSYVTLPHPWYIAGLSCVQESTCIIIRALVKALALCMLSLMVAIMHV